MATGYLRLSLSLSIFSSPISPSLLASHSLPLSLLSPAPISFFSFFFFFPSSLLRHLTRRTMVHPVLHIMHRPPFFHPSSLPPPSSGSSVQVQGLASAHACPPA